VLTFSTSGRGRRPTAGHLRSACSSLARSASGLQQVTDPFAYRRFCKVDTELHLVGDFVPGAEVYLPFRDLYRHMAHVRQSQLPEVYRAADVFVFPTLVEGLGMVVLEAMACGLPVIVTPRGPDEVVRDGVDGYVVPAGDSTAIIETLERLYADVELGLQLGRNARSQAERWSWARYASAAADSVLEGSAR
jgi:starch synthase